MSSSVTDPVSGSSPTPPAAAVATLPGAAATPISNPAKKGAWSPLAIPLFRSLWIATVVSYIGTWARETGGQELMSILAAGKANQSDLVAQVVSFSNLPICLLSIFAGVLADVLDRKRFLVFTQLWMVAVSTVLAILSLTGVITPGSLLFLTLLLGIGTALSGPAFQAIVPELVPPGDMPLAVALNSVALNIARAIGPMIFAVVVGLLVLMVGETFHLPAIGITFLLTAISFTGVAWVLFKWDRAPQRAAVHGESMVSAMRAGVQYTFHSRALRAVLIRVFAFIMCAVVVWAQFKIIAKYQLNVGTAGFGAIMSFMGMGAIVGVFIMPGLQRRFSIDKVVNASTAMFALGLAAMSFVTNFYVAIIVMFFLGINWVVVPTNFNVATQKSVPPWVKGRAISMYLTVLFGSFALGSALWGRVTSLTSEDPKMPTPRWSLLISAGVMAAGLLLVKRYPLTINEGQDLSPAYPKGSMPPPFAAGELPETGEIRVYVDYVIDSAREHDFRRVMHQLAEQRRRNGAHHWELRETSAGHFRETFGFISQAEYARQSGRLTKADLKLQAEAKAFHVGPAPAEPILAQATRIGWRGERML